MLEGTTTYRDEHKEHIYQYNNENITCNVCGCQVNRNGIARHERTNNCKSYTKPIENDKWKGMFLGCFKFQKGRN